MSTKLIHHVDDDIWRSFTGYCKSKNRRVGDKISEVLEEYMKDKIV